MGTKDRTGETKGLEAAQEEREGSRGTVQGPREGVPSLIAPKNVQHGCQDP